METKVLTTFTDDIRNGVGRRGCKLNANGEGRQKYDVPYRLKTLPKIFVNDVVYVCGRHSG